MLLKVALGFALFVIAAWLLGCFLEWNNDDAYDDAYDNDAYDDWR